MINMGFKSYLQDVLATTFFIPHKIFHTKCLCIILFCYTFWFMMRKKNYITIAIVKQSFGTFYALPKCNNAKRFCCIANRLYLTQQDIFHIIKLGFAIKKE